eukprot:1309285-Prymnesium_polylepis.1
MKGAVGWAPARLAPATATGAAGVGGCGGWCDGASESGWWCSWCGGAWSCGVCTTSPSISSKQSDESGGTLGGAPRAP